MNRTHRRVRKDSTISINKVSYDVPVQLIGLKVEVRFLPANMKTAYILFDGKKFPLALHKQSGELPHEAE